MGSDEYRAEYDSMGEVRVPAGALWGAQTQRAVENFALSGLRMPGPFIAALGLVKAAAARVNGELGLIEAELAEAIAAAADEVATGGLDAHFPVDVFQTGSGTSTNMNANEVIARVAGGHLGRVVHPNDHVNRCQSSNDVIPTVLHVSACREITGKLLPALGELEDTLRKRARELARVVKTGRTHLMDAMPITFGQEIGAWAEQVRYARARLQAALARLTELPIGGTAVGTGVNAHPEFAGRVVAVLSARTRIAFSRKPSPFEGMAAQDAAVETSGQLRTLAVGLMKMANDLRWMNSGPLAGLGEIRLPALQPGSSIMPGKVNPVIPEAVAMVCVRVMGNDAGIAVAGQSGSFQLNVMLPLIAHDLLQSIALLANAATLLAGQAIAGFTVDARRVAEALARNPILVTALNDVIGYERGAEIAKRAYAEGRPLLEVAREQTALADEELRRLMDPVRLTGPPGGQDEP